jgi:hypothetical protein
VTVTFVVSSGLVIFFSFIFPAGWMAGDAVLKVVNAFFDVFLTDTCRRVFVAAVTGVCGIGVCVTGFTGQLN